MTPIKYTQTKINRVMEEIATPTSASKVPVAIPKAVSIINDTTMMRRDNFL